MVRAVVLVGLVAVAAAFAGAGEPRPVVRVAVLADGDVTGDDPPLVLRSRDRVLELVQREVEALTARRFDVRFPPELALSGDWTVDGIRRAVDRALAEPSADVVVSLGVIATNELIRRRELPKPVIAAWAVDRAAQALPLTEDDTSGVPNLAYLLAEGSILRDLGAMRRVLPDARRVAILVDRRFFDAIPEVPEVVLQAQGQLGVELHTIVVDRSALDALDALDALPPDVDAVYVTPLLRLPGAGFERLVQGLIERGLPSFSLSGEDEVRRGLMVGARPSTELTLIARRIALNLQRVLLGENAGTLPVLLDRPEKLTINMATAEAIGAMPRWRVLIEAELIDDRRRDGGRELTLSETAREAVAANLGLQATRRELDAGEAAVRGVAAALRPQLELGSTALRVDEDRAAASFGQQPERTLDASIGVTQLVWSEARRADVDRARDGQRARVEGHEAERLDVALEAATAFLDVLRALTLERVERDNLRLTSSNLELARRRESIGAAGPADVYRFEARLAGDRANVIAASNRVHAARVRLNRLLHRPLEEPFVPRPPTLGAPDMITGFGRLRPYIDDPLSFAVFREFAVREGLANAPELRALDASLAAEERALRSARRSFWSPELSFAGSLEREVSRGGAGSTGSPLLSLVPERDSWSAALVATLPLHRGGGRAAEARRASEQLMALRIEQADVADRLELRIRLALFGVASSYAAIELSREAAEAARRTLELVTDAYSRGVVSTIDLVDAQNTSLRAEGAAANAEFDFLADLMALQRATNSFDFFMDDTARESWFERLATFFEGAGARPAAGAR